MFLTYFVYNHRQESFQCDEFWYCCQASSFLSSFLILGLHSLFRWYKDPLWWNSMVQWWWLEASYKLLFSHRVVPILCSLQSCECHSPVCYQSVLAPTFNLKILCLWFCSKSVKSGKDQGQKEVRAKCQEQEQSHTAKSSAAHLKCISRRLC